MPGKVYKRGPVWWVRRDPITGKRQSTGCTDRKAAEAWHARRERIAADPAHAAAHAATISKWVAETMRVKLHTRSAGTQHMYRIKLGHVLRIFGVNARMAEVTPRTVDYYVDTRRAEGAANNTIQRELTSLMQLCKLAKRAGEFPGDLSALKPVGFAAEYTPRRRWLTKDEVWRLVDHFGIKDGRSAWLAFVVCTGARFSEAQAFEARDLDQARGVVRLRGTKTAGSHREVPVVGGVFGRLVEVAAGMPHSWPRASKDLPEACARLGLPPATPNDLRRTCASWLVQAGAETAMVARVLGHRDSKLVDRVYGQVSADKLGKLLGTQTSQQEHGKRQPEKETPEKQQRPLGGTADAGDLKGRAGGFSSSAGSDSEHLGTTAHGQSGWSSAGACTPNAHEQGALAAPQLWALTLAAESLGVRRRSFQAHVVIRRRKAVANG